MSLSFLTQFGPFFTWKKLKTIVEKSNSIVDDRNKSNWDLKKSLSSLLCLFDNGEDLKKNPNKIGHNPRELNNYENDLKYLLVYKLTNAKKYFCLAFFHQKIGPKMYFPF